MIQFGVETLFLLQSLKPLKPEYSSEKWLVLPLPSGCLKRQNLFNEK